MSGRGWVVVAVVVGGWVGARGVNAGTDGVCAKALY